MSLSRASVTFFDKIPGPVKTPTEEETLRPISLAKGLVTTDEEVMTQELSNSRSSSTFSPVLTDSVKELFPDKVPNESSKISSDETVYGAMFHTMLRTLTPIFNNWTLTNRLSAKRKRDIADEILTFGTVHVPSRLRLSEDEIPGEVNLPTDIGGNGAEAQAPAPALPHLAKNVITRRRNSNPPSSDGQLTPSSLMPSYPHSTKQSPKSSKISPEIPRKLSDSSGLNRLPHGALMNSGRKSWQGHTSTSMNSTKRSLMEATSVLKDNGLGVGKLSMPASLGTYSNKQKPSFTTTLSISTEPLENLLPHPSCSSTKPMTQNSSPSNAHISALMATTTFLPADKTGEMRVVASAPVTGQTTSAETGTRDDAPGNLALLAENTFAQAAALPSTKRRMANVLSKRFLLLYLILSHPLA